MSKIKLLLNVVEDMRSLADSIQAVADAMTQSEAQPYKLSDKTARAVSYKERDELIRDVEVKYPQKKKAESVDEIEVVVYEEFEEQSKKAKIKTNRS